MSNDTSRTAAAVDATKLTLTSEEEQKAKEAAEALAAWDTLEEDTAATDQAEALSAWDTLGEDLDRANGEDLISTQMYEGMSLEEAEAKYEKIKTSPDVTPIHETDMLSYTNPETGRKEIVPSPSGAYVDAATSAIGDVWDGEFKKAGERFTDPKATVGFTEKLVGGMAESWGAIFKTAAAGGEKLGFDGLLEAAEEYTTNIDTSDDISDALLTDGAPAAAAAMVALPVSAMASTLTASTLLIRSLAFVAGEIAASSTMNKEEGTALIGKDAALLPIANGVDLGKGDANEIISHRLNTLAEGMGMAGMLKPVIKGAVGTGSLVTKFALMPFWTGIKGGDAAIARRAYAELMQKITMLDGNRSLTPAEDARARQEVVQILEDNKDIFIAGLNTFNEKEAVVIDTVSALLRGVDDPEARSVLAGLRQGHLSSRQGSGQTVAALEGPQRALEGELTGTARQIGGDTPAEQTATITGAAEEFADDGRRIIGAADEALEQAEVMYEAAVYKLTSDLGTDLSFGADLTRLEKTVGSEIPTLKTGKRQEVQQYLKNAYESMNNKKNELYAAVSGGEVNPQTLREIFAAVEPNLTEAQAMASASRPLRDIMALVKPREIMEEVDGKQVTRPETDDEAVARIQEYLDKGGIDFGHFYTTIRAELSKKAGTLYNQNQGAAELLRDIIGEIDGRMVDDVAVGDSALADSAKEAKRYYKEDYAPIWRSEGKLQEYSDIYNSRLGRGEGFRQGFDESAEAITKDILTGYNASSVDNLAQAIKGVDNPDVIADYMILDVVNNLANDIRTGGMDSVDFGKVSELVQQYAEVLNQTFPAKAKKLNEFISQIEKASGDKKELGRVLTANADNVAQAKQAISESELGKFLRKTNPDDLRTTAAPYAVFESILQNKQEGLGIIQDLLTRAEKMDPARQKLVVDGMKVAYMRFLRDKVFSVSQESGGSAAMKKANVRATEEEMNSFLEMGAVVFKDAPEWMTGFTTLLEVAGQISREKGVLPVATMSSTVFLQEAKTASGRMINMMLGPLNRTGTRLRAFIGMVFEGKNPTQRAQMLLDRIYAEPNYIIELARKYDRAPMDEDLKQQLITALISTSTKMQADTQGADEKQQMSDLFPTQ